MIAKKSILVTGANGLLGRQALEEMKGAYNLHALVHREPENILGGVEYHLIDLASDWSYSSLPHHIDFVIHLAQSSRYREFPDQAINVFRINIQSTALLLDYSRIAGASMFIYASSGGVYGSGRKAFFENEPVEKPGNLDYYLNSKLSSEILVQSYATLMHVTVLRFFFMYGKGQKKSMLIPRLVDNIASGQSISLQGQTGILINPVHVTDACKALQAVLKTKGSAIYNIAGPDVLSLRDICEIIGRLVGKKPKYSWVPEKTSNLIGDISAMSNKLAKPSIHFPDGIIDLI